MKDEDIGLVLAEICEAAAALILPLWRSGIEVMNKADESPSPSPTSAARS